MIDQEEQTISGIKSLLATGELYVYLEGPSNDLNDERGITRMILEASNGTFFCATAGEGFIRGSASAPRKVKVTTIYRTAYEKYETRVGGGYGYFAAFFPSQSFNLKYTDVNGNEYIQQEGEAGARVTNLENALQLHLSAPLKFQRVDKATAIKVNPIAAPSTTTAAPIRVPSNLPDLSPLLSPTTPTNWSTNSPADPLAGARSAGGKVRQSPEAISESGDIDTNTEEPPPVQTTPVPNYQPETSGTEYMLMEPVPITSDRYEDFTEPSQ